MKVFLVLLTMLAATATHAQQKDYLIAFTDTSSGAELTGYKTPKGKVVLPAQYEIAATDTFYTMALVVINGKWTGIDRNGKAILYPFIYDNGPDYVEEGVFRFLENEKMGFADMNGKKWIAAKYDFVQPFANGLAAYTLGGKKVVDGEHWTWAGGYEQGFVNHQGVEFSKIIPGRKGYRTAVTKDGKTVRIDKQGRVVK